MPSSILSVVLVASVVVAFVLAIVLSASMLLSVTWVSWYTRKLKSSGWFGFATDHTVDCGSGASIVPFLEPESLLDSQLAVDCSAMDLMAAV